MVRIEILRIVVQRPARLLPLPARCFIQHLLSDRCLTFHQRRGRHSSYQSTKINAEAVGSQHDCCSHKLGIVMNKRNKQASRQAKFGHARVRKSTEPPQTVMPPIKARTFSVTAEGYPFRIISCTTALAPIRSSADKNARVIASYVLGSLFDIPMLS